MSPAPTGPKDETKVFIDVAAQYTPLTQPPQEQISTRKTFMPRDSASFETVAKEELGPLYSLSTKEDFETYETLGTIRKSTTLGMHHIPSSATPLIVCFVRYWGTFGAVQGVGHTHELIGHLTNSPAHRDLQTSAGEAHRLARADKERAAGLVPTDGEHDVIHRRFLSTSPVDFLLVLPFTNVIYLNPSSAQFNQPSLSITHGGVKYPTCSDAPGTEERS